MKPQHLLPSRPEDRRRDSRSADGEWGDTLPQWFRSEGFAEDLPCTGGPLPLQRRTVAPARAAAALPLLGAGVAALLGLRAR